ncbi:hypothetical protein [Acidocella aromatica]|uniref:Uncharacterized protein n=1 Tax=Acidocella aromatica TaxID=1303579 RepID=A0A840VLI0_9PROT|nr:hypothetical protein [Acidocella aromatica]MBB5372441.1 hypothetical protein [Acidocella aromatica]
MLKQLFRRVRRLMMAEVLAELAKMSGELAELRAQLSQRDQQLEAALLTIALAKEEA